MITLDKNVLEKRFDAYIKKTITNTVINYKKYENRKRHREISLELVNEKDTSVPFLFTLYNSLEDYFENEKLYTVVSNLKEIQKKVLEMRVLQQCSYDEIANTLNKSNSRIRSIYSETIKEIKNKMKE